MIPNQWYAVLESREVRRGRLTGVTRLGEKLVLWRDQAGRVHCLADQCCHRGAALHIGKLCEGQVCCPFHGFAYAADGHVSSIPANGRNTPVADRYRVKAFKTAEQNDLIWLWSGQYQDDAPPVPFFRELQQGYSYGSFSETWPVHYTRAIENQLDVVHLPFVHASTIGRGNHTLVNGPVVEWEDNLMTFYVDNHVDDGFTRPLRADEIKHPERLFQLQFQMPNLWQNVISEQIRIVAVFAPVDDGNTRIYIRFYQNFARLPGLKQLINWLSRFGNRTILHQDRRVVITQRPIQSDLKIGEKLIQGDAPIIEYRKRRAELQDQSFI